MEFSKKDAKMTKGLAIVCMVVLHLFCRTGSSVLGQPLIWLNEETPFVFWFGFYAEICVPLYSICAGYAHQHLYQTGRSGFGANIRRIGRLMLNYWIVLGVFTLVCLCIGNDHMPGSGTDFLKSLVLLHSYNGAWWYLNTYVICLLLPVSLLLFPVKKMNACQGIFACWGLQVVVYLINRLGMIPTSATNGLIGFVLKESVNLLNVLPYFWLGAVLCKGGVVRHVRQWWHGKTWGKNSLLLLMGMLLFVFTNVVHKAVLTGAVALFTFLLFNLWDKSKGTQRVFLFLGEHSTNIWLTHMFFYAYIFEGLVVKARYPILMFPFMMLLCWITSCVIKGIQKQIEKGTGKMVCMIRSIYEG